MFGPVKVPLDLGCEQAGLMSVRVVDDVFEALEVADSGDFTITDDPVPFTLCYFGIFYFTSMNSDTNI